MYIGLKSGTVLYRGINDKNDTDITGKAMWFSVDKADALLYGNKIIKYKLLKDINLLNITDINFHNNYLNILNLLYTGTNYDSVDAKKIEAAIPDYEVQCSYLHSKGILLNNTVHWTNEHEIASRFLMNRHRYSTFERDKLLVSTLYKIYGTKCEGYISKIKWPSKLHDGFFNREICLFSPSAELLIEQKTGGKEASLRKNVKIKKRKGGSNYEIVPEGDSWNRMNQKMELIPAEELFKDSNIEFVMENLDKLV